MRRRRILPDLRSISFLLFLWVVQSTAARNPTQFAVHHVVRGGSSWGPLGTRQSAKPLSRQSGSSSATQSAMGQQMDKEEVKEVMSSFLTRDSRNTFIGKHKACIGIITVRKSDLTHTSHTHSASVCHTFRTIARHCSIRRPFWYQSEFEKLDEIAGNGSDCSRDFACDINHCLVYNGNQYNCQEEITTQMEPLDFVHHRRSHHGRLCQQLL